MQQSSRSQAPMGSLLVLSRFSHTVTTVNSHARLVWTHINGDGDLHCEMTKLAGSELSRPSLIIKVIHNGKILEQLDLGKHVSSVKNEPRSSQNDANSKPAFAVMVKLPCIAIKYLQDDTHLRRFQVKFAQDCDYYTALSMISSIDCPMADGTLPTLRGPTTAQMPNNPPRQTGPIITPESNATGPFNRMARTATGFESLASNAPSTTSTKAYQPVSNAFQDSMVVQSESASNETTLRCGPLGINPQPGPAASERVPSRQSTGPIYHDKELNQMLPPKRDLPFLKAKSKMSRADTSSLKSSQQVIPESSYPEPTLKQNESSISELQSQQLIQTQPYPETMEPSQISSHIQATLPYPGANTDMQQPVAESSAAASTRGLQAAGHVNATNVQSVARSTEASAEEQLSLYLRSPTPARTVFLSTWMCELIQDDDFVTLCEDVEGTWRRFAFGKKQ